MSNNYNETLNEIRKDIKEILLYQREFQIHKKEQENINRQLMNELKLIESRTNSNENNIALLQKEDEYTKKTILLLEKNFEKLTELTCNNDDELKIVKSKAKTHSKLFWSILSLNITLIGAVITQVIKNFLV